MIVCEWNASCYLDYNLISQLSFITKATVSSVSSPLGSSVGLSSSRSSCLLQSLSCFYCVRMTEVLFLFQRVLLLQGRRACHTSLSLQVSMEHHHNTSADGSALQAGGGSLSSTSGGIGNIFLCPPGEDSWEITCILKSGPEDFVVREIGGMPPLSYITHYPKELTCVDVIPRIADVHADRPLHLEHALRSVVALVDNNPLDNENQTIEQACIDDIQNSNKVDDEQTALILGSPLDAIQAILAEFDGHGLKSSLYNISVGTDSSSLVHSYSQALEFIYKEALEDIILLSQQQEGSAVIINDSFIVIPPFTNPSPISFHGISSIHSSRSTRNGNQNRGTFHRACALHFPLLLTCTLSTDESRSYMSSQEGYDVSKGDGDCKWIKVSKDSSLHRLIPFLSHPRDDLISLYTYWKRGPRSTLYHNTENHVSLRLKPGLDKEKRQSIHHIIRSMSHDLETETSSLAHVADNSNSNRVEERTILVRWSRHALRKTQMKTNNSFSNKSNKVQDETPRDQPTYNNTLFVLKKTNIEHATAVYKLCAALKCKASDITFAGIKDKVATTYQFVTVRNISPHCVEGCAKNLDPTLEIGNGKSVPWVLSHGDLKGNEFHLILRNMKRRRISSAPLGSSGKDKMGGEEPYDSCPLSYMTTMVNRILKFGFINYYGEQRVGIAGTDSGVRPADIGKAMLQQDFQKTIDLIMQGRGEVDSDGNYMEGHECRTIRRTWKESGRCPVATLKVFPKGMSIMPRERAILQGLKRFGKSEYLAALRCLPFNVRMFWIHAYQSYIFNVIATERILRFGRYPVVGDLISSDSLNGSIQYIEDPSVVEFNQILLPLPGYGVKYPNNEIGTLYKEILDRDGIVFDKKSVCESTAHGSYRNIIAMPHNLNWRLLDAVQDECDPSSVISTAEFQFSLQSGCYATMFLRELLWTTTNQS